MALLLDTNLWIGLTRRHSPRALKNLIAPYIQDPYACLAEPVVFEVLRHATDPETLLLTEYFQTLPLLASPPDLWSRALPLARSSHAAGFVVGSIDLLIATIAIHHGAELVTFDRDFQRLAGLSDLRVKVLQPPQS
jgi:predicted nucleic acid-binding protein